MIGPNCVKALPIDGNRVMPQNPETHLLVPNPTVAGMAQKAVLYTRQDCHLCEQARQVLERNGFRVESVDIDRDESLRQQFDLCVPVVEINGRVRFRGRVNEILLRRLVDHQKQGSQD